MHYFSLNMNYVEHRATIAISIVNKLAFTFYEDFKYLIMYRLSFKISKQGTARAIWLKLIKYRLFYIPSNKGAR